MPLQDNLWRDTVSLIPHKTVPSVSPTSSIRDAVGVMRKHRTGCVTITDNGKLVGIFTERDLLKRVLAARLDPGRAISTVMTKDPTTVRDEELVGSVLEKMRDGGYRHLPVVDENGAITGRISVREIVHYMVEYFPKEVYNLPPDPGRVQSSREGA